MNFYNEIDLHAAQTLRNLIAAGHIPPGVVDTRSIEDIKPNELKPYTQCHFFAGIGIWSLALRQAGWPDTKPVWTGSCPCQPFSTAGQGLGFDDERHLWPYWHYLIDECEPADILGEQVASKAADPWFDLVQDDLEGMGYSFGAVPFPAAGVGAPHIRDRTYWVAHSDHGGRQRWWASQARHGRDAARVKPERLCAAGGLGNAGNEGLAQRIGFPGVFGFQGGANQGQAIERASLHSATRPGPTNGPWRDADWLLCRDGKWRPVEPGTFPLAHGAPARVGRLRGYGNAINAYQAQIFIETVMEILA